MDKYIPGSIVTYTVTYRDIYGTPITPVDPYVEILAPDATTIRVTPTQIDGDVGQYRWAWTVPATPIFGIYTYIEYGTISGQLVSSSAMQFRVQPDVGLVEDSAPLSRLIGYVRTQIRDNCPTQVFPDVIDYTLATPAPIPNSSPELAQFVRDALAEYSRYRPLRKPFTLAVVAGQKQYSLPPDWIEPDMTAFNRAVRPTNVPDLLQYMLPYVEVSPALGAQQSSLQFEWYNDIQIVALNDSPLANYTLDFAYLAMHTPETLPLQWQHTAMMVACEKALRAIATDQAVKIQQYKIANNIEVDNRKIAEHLIKQADDYRERFRREVVMRPHGAIGEADSVGYWM
jgi:hypothetical protein